MNKLTQTALMTALLAAAPLALANPGYDQQARGMQDPLAGASRHLASAVKRLDLEDDQQAAIRAIFEDNRDDLQANLEASRDVYGEIRNLLTDLPLDEDALADLARQQGELAEERVLLTGTMASDVLGELDETQREELAAMQDERRERRRERFSSRSDRN